MKWINLPLEIADVFKFCAYDLTNDCPKAYCKTYVSCGKKTCSSKSCLILLSNIKIKDKFSLEPTFVF